MPIQPTVLKAPAKLNLTLEVLNKREDGYHSIRSVMVPIDLADEIHIEPAPSFSFSCSVPELEENNLVISALRALGIEGLAAAVRLIKRIPAGAGMGGGSSDAAAILLAAQSGVFGAIRSRDYLEIARMLGSDVPFFLVETGALVEHTGERVTAIGALPSWYALVVKPPVQVDTARAYRAVDEIKMQTRPRNASPSLEMVEALQMRDFARTQGLLSNDFQTVVASLAPEISVAMEALKKAGAEKPLMTGSGSCVYALTGTRDECERLARSLVLERSFEQFVCGFYDAHVWRAEVRE
ncbi:MAG: 4-(cytidine 5'-diphospho)-2-C-methyl-D-erythritol kinase [Candidatus Eremiobacteraeota bacterium]|nr:4-(cytidine 5'-diphospho)-2-C-methyl-D-erythritol kinase [Candidatus Eremiobacteraeota bacterium]